MSKRISFQIIKSRKSPMYEYIYNILDLFEGLNLFTLGGHNS